MITENDLRISSQSYTNKDFESVYNELLTLAKNISYKYDPTASNESDPFIVLLKLLAFATDKINYNVDKNILERFMPSATQESSMSDLTSRLGYNMHYYKSATTSAYFEYSGEITNDLGIVILARQGIIKNDTGHIQYINLDQITIDKDTKQSNEVPLIQGELKLFTVLGNDKIQLENLDENRRLYFPESQVAENGVFIEGGSFTQESNVNETLWNKVDNLNTQRYNYPCYIFRFDSRKNLPYIEFPEWISNIIGEGLTISYLITAGINGNVTARSLSTLMYNFNDTDIITDDIIVRNSNGALNGANPETIDEAYQGFKKTIGTFDTLVSCRDYANFIYNALNSQEVPLVSNVQVSDRRTDINFARNVVEYNQYGVETKSETSMIDEISPNEICIYPLKYVNDPTYSFEKGSANYDTTFTRLTDTTSIETELFNNEKALSHDYKSLQPGDLFCIKNYYTLNAIISTTYKVNTLEQQNIIENVKIALSKNFNARNVDFGYEIPYDTLLKTIQEADARIKSVSLQEPEQTSKGVVIAADEKTTEEQPIKVNGEATNWFKLIVAQNILSGKISLFKYDEEFVYDYLQGAVEVNQNADSPLFYNVKSISSYANIGNISNNPYKLRANEVIQFIAPNFKSDVTYPYGVNYYLQLSDGTYIEKNSEYTLQSGDLAIFNYTDNSDNEIWIEYHPDKIKKNGNIIKEGSSTLTPNFIMYTSDYRSTPRPGYSRGETPTKIDSQNRKYYTLTANQEVTPEEVNEEVIKSPKFFYWYTKDVVLNDEGIPCSVLTWLSFPNELNSYYHILEEGEYFFYADSNFTSLYTYGPGTKLILKGITETVLPNTFGKELEKVNDIFKISQEGIQALKPYSIYINLTDNNYLILQEQEIITLTTNDQVKINSDSESDLLHISNNVFDPINNEIANKIQYLLEGEDEDSSWENLPRRNNTNVQWWQRGLLDISSGPELEQTLEGNDSSGNQSITIEYFGKGDTSSSSQPPTGWPTNYFLENSATGAIEQAPATWREGLTYYYLNNVSINYSTTSSSESNNVIPTFKLSKLTQEGGDTNISLMYRGIDERYNYPTLYVYEKKDNNYSYFLTKFDSHYYNVDTAALEKNGINNFSLDLPNLSEKSAYIMCYTQGTTSENYVKVNVSDGGSVIGYNKELGSDSNISEGMHILKLTNASDITFNFSEPANKKNISLVLSMPRYAEGINPLLGLNTSDSGDNIEDFMSNDSHPAGFGNSSVFGKFYATNYVDDSKALEVSSNYPLNNSLSFYDYNNVGNKWTISQIDFQNSDIRIAKSSMK